MKQAVSLAVEVEMEKNTCARNHYFPVALFLKKVSLRSIEIAYITNIGLT